MLPGYELHFIQKRPCNDESAHLFSLIYKFRSPITKYGYVVTAEYHEQNVFAIKFYCKKDKHSEYKYSKIVNKGDCLNILNSCAKLIPILLAEYPTASFGFGAARSIDPNNKTVEGPRLNQRFRIYKYIIEKMFGTVTFAHFEYPEISCYLLVNKLDEDPMDKEKVIKSMFAQTYMNLLDI